MAAGIQQLQADYLATSVDLDDKIWGDLPAAFAIRLAQGDGEDVGPRVIGNPHSGHSFQSVMTISVSFSTT